MNDLQTPSQPKHPTQETPPASSRIRSVDLLRGLVMVLMAIDHVRVYSGIPAWGATPGIFFTRWVTHFCVPSFVFFAGTSAFLYGTKIKDNRQLSRFLFTRGFFLIVLEWTLIRFSWTFNFAYTQFTLAGVIWMLGWCMILLALLVWLPRIAMLIIGILLIVFQQLFARVPGFLPPNGRGAFSWYWEFIYPTGMEYHSGISILYVIVPWIGVMMLGYCFGRLLLMDPTKRKKCCLIIGFSVITAFIIVAVILTLRSNGHEDDRGFIYRLLDQRKYPPSILYLLMTLGPIIALIPFAERVKGRVADIFILFGRIPLFYYLIHIPLIHLAALAVNLIRQGAMHQEWYTSAPYTHVPPEGRWSLPLLYLVFILVEVLLYMICKRYAAYKGRHPEKKWLKYL
jgi:uncharacterized membrane protein